MYMCMYVCLYVCMHVCMNIRTYIHKYLRPYVLIIVGFDYGRISMNNGTLHHRIMNNDYTASPTYNVS